MTQREITAVVRDKKGRVRLLYNPGAEWSPVSAGEAAAQIRSAAHQYIVSSGGPGFVVVRPYGERWVRTIRDGRRINNLDELPPPEFAELPTGAFDLVVTLAPSALDMVLCEMHAAGTISDRQVLLIQDKVIELKLGPPVLTPFTNGDGSSCTVTREALAWVSAAARTGDPGFSAVVTTRSIAHIETLPREQQGEVALRLAYSAHPTDPVTLQTALPAEQANLLHAALTKWLTQPSADVWTMALPPELTALNAIQTRLTPGGHLQIGMAFEQQIPNRGFPDDGELTGWSIAFSRQFLAARLRAAFAAEFGDAPPPAGTGRVEVDAHESIYVDYLELCLEHDAVVLHGRAIRDVDPVVSAFFRVRFTIGLTATGLVTVSTDDIDVDVVEWYAKVFDFLSGSALSRALRDGLRASIASSGGTGGMSAFLSGDLISAIARAGTIRDISVNPRVTSVSVEPGGLIIGGVFKASPRPRPQAILTALTGAPGAPTVLYGGGSLVPGGVVREVRWDFGDGTTQTLSGADRTLVAGHTYAAGRYSARITVIGEDGREGSDSASVRTS